MLALHDLPSATLPALPLALPSTAPAEDAVPKDATTLQMPAEAPESHAAAQPSESMPGGADPTSPYQKIMDKLKISLENRKNAKNQAEKADLNDAPKKALAKAKSKAKASKNSNGKNSKNTNSKPAGKPKAKTGKPQSGKAKAKLCKEIPASLKRKYAEGCSRCRYRARSVFSLDPSIPAHSVVGFFAGPWYMVTMFRRIVVTNSFGSWLFCIAFL